MHKFIPLFLLIILTTCSLCSARPECKNHILPVATGQDSIIELLDRCTILREELNNFQLYPEKTGAFKHFVDENIEDLKNLIEKKDKKS